MPKKELNRTYDSDEHLHLKLSKGDVVLPGSLKLKYTVGKMIGDGKNMFCE